MSHSILLSVALALFSFVCADELQRTSAKRGLVYVPSTDYPNDDKIWVSNSSDLTWYYNYKGYPSLAYENYSDFEFVPMLWGAPASTSDTTFLTNVTAQILSGANITYVMSFNEPDGTSATGGSNVSPSVAAKVWQRQLEPLRRLGVSLGAPGVTGANTGFTWLQDFFTACDGNCTADFLPIHWYGDFSGLASHVGQVQAMYPNMSIWATEFALQDATLPDSQTFFNTSIKYFDRLENVTRYSYFGAFRSDVSNIGPNATFLTEDGKLTDIGSWYLGGDATGNIPHSTAAKSNATHTATKSSTATGWGTWIIPTSAATPAPEAGAKMGLGLAAVGLAALL